MQRPYPTYESHVPRASRHAGHFGPLVHNGQPVRILSAVCLLVWLLSSGATLGAQKPAEDSGNEESRNHATTVLDLGTCIDSALRHDAALRQSTIDLATAERESGNFRAHFIPGISVGGGVSYSDPLFSEDTSPRNVDPVSYSANLSLSLELNSSIRSSMSLADIAHESALVNYIAARRDIIADITKRFYGLITTREELGLLEEDLELARRQLEKTEIRFRNGLANERSLLQARLTVEKARLEYDRSTSQYELDKRGFFADAGLDAALSAEPEGTIEVSRGQYDAETLIENHLAGREDMRLQRLTIERLQARRSLTRSSTRSPTLSLSTRWTGGLEDIPDFSESSFSDSLSAGVSVRIPLDPYIPGSSGGLELHSASAEIEKARIELEHTRSSAELEIRNLVSALEQAAESMDISRMQVDLAERSYALADTGFQRGTVERLELEEIRREMLEAKQQLLSAEYDYLTAQIDLLRALGLGEEELRGFPDRDRTGIAGGTGSEGEQYE